MSDTLFDKMVLDTACEDNYRSTLTWGPKMGQQASHKASVAQLSTTPPSRGTPVGNKVRGGRPSPRRYMRVPRGENSEGRMMELVNARERWCLEKNTERKDLGDHLSIHPEYIEDEVT